MSDKPEQCELEEEPVPAMCDEPEMFGGMLNAVMANYFEYEHPDGDTLNLAEVLLLIKQSIDQNTEAVKELSKSVRAHSK